MKNSKDEEKNDIRKCKSLDMDFLVNKNLKHIVAFFFKKKKSGFGTEVCVYYAFF